MRKLTDLDKLECAEYVLNLLNSKLATDDGGTVYPSERGVWIQRCKDECIMRRGQYLVVDTPPAPKGEEDE